MQDNRLVDIPLSTTFLRLMLSPEITKSSHSSNSYFSPLTTIDDLAQIHPLKANFLRSLQQFIQQKQAIENDCKLTESAKKESIAGLKLKLGEQDHGECSVDDLGLSFVLNPPSSIFAYKEIELVEQGSKVDVTADNVEEYVEKCLDFYLNTGIREQVTAFRQGFDLVFPLSSLTAFTPSEVQVLLSGEQCPQWTRDDIMKYTEPKLGYSRDSAGFLHFVTSYAKVSAVYYWLFFTSTRRSCQSPPRLTVVRKVGSGDGSFPSVNTCVHYLKLPEYSCAEILRERLLAATYERVST
uniref:E3 ubiquitin-protein ligase n=1 Tax=Ditylenchus dipsaci TaxID=166011 RepID=A0A915EF74_9BILA